MRSAADVVNAADCRLPFPLTLMYKSDTSRDVSLLGTSGNSAKNDGEERNQAPGKKVLIEFAA